MLVLEGLVIVRQTLDEVMDREDQGRGSARKGQNERLRLVTDYDMVETKRRHPNCKCEQYGLHAGMTVNALLLNMGSGCTNGRWVCPRLDSLRRLYGH